MKTILSRFDVDYFFSVPPETKIIWFWLGFFVVALAATVLAYLYFKAKSRVVKPYKRYAKNLLWPNLTITLVGIFLSLARYEKLAMLSWRFWVYFDLLLLVVFNIWYFMIKRSQLEDDIIKFHNTKRKEKWLNPAQNTKYKTKK